MIAAILAKGCGMGCAKEIHAVPPRSLVQRQAKSTLILSKKKDRGAEELVPESR